MNFKKILSMILAIAMVLTTMGTVVLAEETMSADEIIIEEAELAEEVAEEADAELMAEKPYSGRGTESEPYSIGTLEELVAFANDVNAGLYKNVFIYAELTANIDVANCADTSLFPNGSWMGIGNANNPFFGVFNGNNYTVSNLKFPYYVSYTGFFGNIGLNNSEYVSAVNDLTIDGIAFQYVRDNSGGLAGRAFAVQVNNVTVKNASICGYGTGVGGLVGTGYVIFKNSHFSGEITGYGVRVGGIMGDGSIIADSCSVRANVAGYSVVGGIMGFGNGEAGLTSIKNCYVEGNIAASNVYADANSCENGGIMAVATLLNPVIQNNYFNGTVTTAGEETLAPVIGCFNEIVDSNTNFDNVYGNSWCLSKMPQTSFVFHEWGVGYSRSTLPVGYRNYLLVAIPEDLDYLYGYNLEDVVLMPVFAEENGVTENDLTFMEGVSEIVVEFEKVTPATAEGEMVYNINLKGKDGVKINRLNSADLEFILTTDSGDIKYEILASNDEVTINEVAKGRYEFHYAGKDDADSDTANVITIGQVKFTGVGQFDFAVKSNETNEVHATTFYNNIVDTFIPGGSVTDATVGNLNIGDALIENAVIEVPTRDLEVQIDFNNAANKNSVDYQDMTVVVSGSDIEDIEIKLGDTDVTYDLDIFGKSQAQYKIDTNADNKYVVTIAGALTSEGTYTVTVKGAGYRTVRKNVTMNEDPTVDNIVKFWNNVKDAEGADYLAGDIVKDNTINVYDLSAVVSYFGRTNATTEVSKYAKYDLNRDGKIDSKDVAYVLVSWGK